MAKYIILDTETTGVDEEDRIIQLGYMVLSSTGIEVYNELCSSEINIKYPAMETHGIVPQMLENKPICVETEAYNKLLELNTDKNYLIIHNAPFDLTMLEKEGFKVAMKVIDTLRVARHIFPDEEAHRLQFFRYKMELYKQEDEEAKKLGIVVKAHDAIGDVLILKLFLSKLKEKVKQLYPDENPVEKMVELTNTPVIVKKLNFGKYKGETLEDIAIKDKQYLKWILKSMDTISDDLRYSINSILES